METADSTTIFLAWVGSSYLILCVFVARALLQQHGPRRRVVALMLLYVLLSMFWTLSQASPQLGSFTHIPSDLLERFWRCGLPVLSLILLCLTRQFLQLEGVDWKWWALGAAWLAIAVVLNEGFLELPESPWLRDVWGLERQGIAFGTLIAGWAGFMAGAALLTLKAYRRTRQPLHRNRITYWFWVLGLTSIGAVSFFAGYEIMGYFFHLMGAVGAVYLTLTFHLPDVRQVSRRTMSYLLLTILAVITYAAGFLAMHHILQSIPGFSPVIAGVSMALLLALLIDPLRVRVQALVDRLLTGTRYDPSSTLREYSASINTLLDLEELATVAVDLVSRTLVCQHGALFVVRPADDREYFQLRDAALGGADQPPGLLLRRGPIADFFCQERYPLTQYDIDLLPRFRTTLSAEREWLNNLDMDVYVPIYAKGEWIGLLALGPKISGDRYFDDDLDLLSTLADQTAMALQNARLFDDLKMQNVENEHLNEELTTANRRLSKLEHAKSDFIQIASHELRTPLTRVRGYLDLLSELLKHDSLTPEAGEQMTEGIRTAVQRLEEISKAMFDVSKIDTETLTLKLWPTPIDSAMSTVADYWKEALDQRNLTLTTWGLNDLPLIIADRKRLEQAFSEIVQNAIKFTPDGGRIYVTGALHNEDKPNTEQTIEIIIADTGIGIAIEDLERVFDKFYRVGDILLHSTGTIKFKGAGPGLGLTIARGIVEAHGGSIWADSPGRDERTCPGAKFHIVLPVQPHDVEPAKLETALADTHTGH